MTDPRKLIKKLFGKDSPPSKVVFTGEVEAIKLDEGEEYVLHLNNKDWVKVSVCQGRLILVPSGSENVKTTRILGSNLKPAIGILKLT